MRRWRCKGQDHPWVSRGGLKLAHALDAFRRSTRRARSPIDVGASTGGFTDVLLTNGAAKVYAVDVGHGQLAWKLRKIRASWCWNAPMRAASDASEIPEPVDWVVCDASFIGLETVLPAALALAKPGAGAVALIKPQFEVGPERVGKGGVVRDPALHREVCERIRAWFDRQPGWSVLGIVESPILGPEGNKEFLIAAAKETS